VEGSLRAKGGISLGWERVGKRLMASGQRTAARNDRKVCKY